MGLEQAGGSSLNDLVKRIKERFPDYNFDITPEPDTKCKSQYDCKGLRNITYSDTEGNIYCGRRYKLQDDNNPHAWSFKECHALLQKKRQGGIQDEIPF
jgi:hypothetical protein